MARISVKDLAKELDTTPSEIALYLIQCGYKNVGSLARGIGLLHEDEEQDCRDHWTDPTPHEQWRNTDGAPDTPWSED